MDIWNIFNETKQVSSSDEYNKSIGLNKRLQIKDSSICEAFHFVLSKILIRKLVLKITNKHLFQKISEPLPM